MTDQSPVPDIQPLIPDLAAATATASELRAQLSSAELREAIESDAKAAEELAQATAKVELAFPKIGFIDAGEELEKMRRLAADMPEDARRQYPEHVRAKLLAYHAKPSPETEVSDEELALAIYIRRTTDSPLSAEEVEAKTTGKVKASATAKEKKPKETKKSLDDLLGGF